MSTELVKTATKKASRSDLDLIARSARTGYRLVLLNESVAKELFDQSKAISAMANKGIGVQVDTGYIAWIYKKLQDLYVEIRPERD